MTDCYELREYATPWSLYHSKGPRIQDCPVDRIYPQLTLVGREKIGAKRTTKITKISSQKIFRCSKYSHSKGNKIATNTSDKLVLFMFYGHLRNLWNLSNASVIFPTLWLIHTEWLRGDSHASLSEYGLKALWNPESVSMGFRIHPLK